MTRFEREALEAILGEHRQTRRPIKTTMIAIACNVLSASEKEAVGRALQRLHVQGLISDGGSGWMPAPGAQKALNQAAPKADPGPSPEAAPMESGFKRRRAETKPEPAKPKPAPVASAIPAELLDRCAAMHLTLLEQVRREYAQGNERAGRELAWLIETGEQLVAAGGAR